MKIDSSSNNDSTIPKNNIKTVPIIIAFLIAGFVGLFSETALNMALNSLIADFNINEATVQWLTTGYLLTLGILVPVSGLILQWFTTRQLFSTSLIFSIIGTLVAALAPTFTVLMIARVIQAIGTALLLPLMFNTILVLIPPQNRGKVMGLMGLVISFAPAVGPTISGLILNTLTWHWIFWVCLPVLAVAFIFGTIFMQNVTTLTKPKIDILSIVLSTVGFGGIVYGFSSAGEGGGWGSLEVVLTLVVGVIALVLFAIRQLTMKQPTMDLRAFKYPMFVIGLVLVLVVMMVMLSSMIILPMYLQSVLALSTFTAGLLLLPGGIMNGLLSPIMGGLFDKFGPRWLVIPGLLFILVALYGFSTIDLETTKGFIIGVVIVLMVGISMVMMPAQTNGLNQLPPELYPHGTAIMNTLQQVSGAIGTAVAISLLVSGTKEYLSQPEEATNPLNPLLAFVEGAHNAFTFAIIITIIGLVFAFFIKRVKVEHK
ncbi:DHA2 family efflux MFS transporter permease subunit [Solibacillus sp. FSL W7-1464]|uniref:DHA2 family efflux MFS transporter permease subunit n=1 Tax=Solibacillus sp. FSL W7-1464 TaxID=2921706 RepID=UPI0030FA1D74